MYPWYIGKEYRLDYSCSPENYFYSTALSQNPGGQLCLIKASHKKIFPPGDIDGSANILCLYTNLFSFKTFRLNILSSLWYDKAFHSYRKILIKDFKASPRYNITFIWYAKIFNVYAPSLCTGSHAFYMYSVTLDAGSLTFNPGSLTFDADSLAFCMYIVTLDPAGLAFYLYSLTLRPYTVTFHWYIRNSYKNAAKLHLITRKCSKNIIIQNYSLIN